MQIHSQFFPDCGMTLRCRPAFAGMKDSVSWAMLTTPALGFFHRHIATLRNAGRWPQSPRLRLEISNVVTMTRLALILSIICGALLMTVAYLSLTVVEQHEEILCGSRSAHAAGDCS
jgi:hypothetical protein